MEHLGYSPITLASLSRGRLLAQGGQLEEAAAELDRVVALARARSEPEWVACALATFAAMADWTGEDHDALARSIEALRITEELGNVMFRIVALHGIGTAHLLAGDIGEATRMLNLAVDEARTFNAGRFEEASILPHRARARIAAGDARGAIDDVNEAVRISRLQRAPLVGCQALLTQAQVLRMAGAPDEAANILEVTATQVCQTGARTYEPFIHEELGRLHDDEQELRDALRLYRQIGATGHARRLEAELSAGSVRGDGSQEALDGG